MPLDISTPDALTKAVNGRTDEVILSDASSSLGGVVGILDSMFGGMRDSFKPDDSAQKRNVIQYDVTHPEGVQSYSLIIENGTCTLEKGPNEKPRITMAISFTDFLRLASKELDGMQAFTTGKMKIRGDLMFAQKMAKWFGQPS